MQGGLFSQVTHSRARRSETVKLQMLSRKRVCMNKICACQKVASVTNIFTKYFLSKEFHIFDIKYLYN